MKKVFKILLCFISSIVILLSLAFIFIEGRLLFSGDWLVYDNPFGGFIRYFSRLLLALFALTKSVLEIIYINKELKIKEYLFYSDFALVIMSIVVLLLSTNYVGIVCIGVSILLLGTKILERKS